MMPDYLFEASWEVCNKVGGIHTVLATKSESLAKDLKDKHILIGPDVWMETAENPEFTPDPVLFRSWRLAAAQEGLRVRIGRWNVPSHPIAILVDYTQFIAQKDEILTGFWTAYGLDSISGQWDFVEPALFGYAAGKVIESFVRYNVQSHNKVVANFHEWMAGGGLLYLKGSPVSVATVFTTHATVVGRCLACNNVPLYDSMDRVQPEEKAREFNVVAKHSMEKCAANQADVFTTVSEITAVECERFLGRKVDVVTPNGFVSSLVPAAEELRLQRSAARQTLVNVAEAMSGQTYENPFLLSISGRYEYKNKGLDVFLDAMARLNAQPSGRKVLAFILVPGGHNGPNRELLARLSGQANGCTTCTTHTLQDPETDPILRRMHALSLQNRPEDRVHIFFVPSYLNGNDGVLNKPYYELLSGMDMTAFPSYYEPWGYTPLESLAFHVPTVTTSVAGFGLWVREYYRKEHPAIRIIERNDSNYNEVVIGVADRIERVCGLSAEEMEEYRANAADVASIARWRNNVSYYKTAYSQAIHRLVERHGAYPEHREESVQGYQRVEVSRPSWGQVLVNRQLPDRLKHLDTLSRNLWWCWNQQAIDLFKDIDPLMWEFVNQNPIALLDTISYKKYKELEKDEAFLAAMDRVYADFQAYMEGKKQRKGPAISYFCMEYGLDTSLKIYSGGLGILAGDYLKESSDMAVNMTAFGFLYRYGYFTQKLSGQGDQVATYDAQDFMKIPAVPVYDKDKNWLKVSVAFPGRNIYARLWRVDVGRTELYLLDTDYEDNLPEDRQVTHHLYGGDWENRLKQELLLGIGGIRAMRALGIKADVYHCNEGHAAFIGLERLSEYVAENYTFGEAVELVRSSSLFTTHTPVPAGHDAFSEDLLRKYIAHFPARLKIDWTGLMALGKLNAHDPGEKFSMSNLACNLSQEVNGVSWLHGIVSQDILSGLWPGYLPEELHVGYVTNGVHYPTWTAPEWKEVHARVFGESFQSHQYDKECFRGIYEVANEEVWQVRSKLRSRLIQAVRDRLSDPSATNHYSPHHIVKIRETLREDVLTIGFARRFATYKRAHLLFRDLNRLDELVNNPERPVQFLFAGKAHPADKAGQDLIRRIVEISKMPQFIGKIVFVPNYDINLAKLMVQGVDVWMNNPTRPLEASGTSGEKAAMNGVMHFSVLDGWWVEGYKEGAGWALPMERTYDDQNYQDELDAATIYNIIENEIAPAYYDRTDATGLPVTWIGYIKNTVAMVACNFTTNRMMNDYLDKYYNPLYKRSKALLKSDGKVAREIAFWKKQLRREWPHIEVLSFDKPDSAKGMQMLGKTYRSEIRLMIGDINPEDIGIELLFATQDKKGKYHVEERFTYRFESLEAGVATYRCNILPNAAGLYQVAARMFAKNNQLPHRQDFELVKWL